MALVTGKSRTHFLNLDIVILKEEGKTFFRELEAQSCEAIAVTGNVTSLEDVQQAVALASRPIAGIIQLSMVLRVSLQCQCKCTD